MRALTATEIAKLIPAQGDEGTLTTITVTGHPPPPPSPPPPTGGPPPPPSPPPIPHCPVNPPATNVNNSTIIANEGGILQNGYVPNGGVGVGATSGVTIGAGVDLAHQFSVTLGAWGLNSAELAQVAPYVERLVPHLPGPPIGQLGPTGTAAAAALAHNGPLTIPAADATTLSNNAIAAYASRASSSFNSLSGQNFSNLPSAVQTAMTDMTFLQGSLTALSGMSAAIQAKNWSQVASILQNSGNARLAADGNAIAAAISSGTLPANGAICI